MTTPTIEQIDAAIKSAPKKSGDFMLDAGQAHYFLYHHLNDDSVLPPLPAAGFAGA